MGTYLFGAPLGVTRLDKRRKAKKEKLPKGMKRSPNCAGHHACVCYLAEINRLETELNYFRDPRVDLLLRLAPVLRYLERALSSLNAASVCVSNVALRLNPDGYTVPKKKKKQRRAK
ncbi:MAG TPA: hypothetical protein VNO43_12630 [Candidatus Eisenbacteria bacterium]|nr:hypothetical protein [Candidatus Eisenbacteria bacterium]